MQQSWNSTIAQLGSSTPYSGAEFLYGSNTKVYLSGIPKYNEVDEYMHGACWALRMVKSLSRPGSKIGCLGSQKGFEFIYEGLIIYELHF